MQAVIKYFISTLILWQFTSSLFSQVPLNWIVDEVSPGEDISLSPDESIFTEGTKSCHMQLHSGAVPYLISDIFYITPGVNYEFSIDVYDNDTAGQIKVYADFFDTYGFNIFGAPPVFSSDSSQWQTISWQGTIPVQAVVGYILVKFYCQPNLYSFSKFADIWIDNIRFQESGADNLVVNGSFEEWIVWIDESPNATHDLIIYPNPAWDFLNIELKEGIEILVISDLMGREKIRMEIDNISSYSMDISGLPEGMYLLSVIYEDNYMRSQRLFISRR